MAETQHANRYGNDAIGRGQFLITKSHRFDGSFLLSNQRNKRIGHYADSKFALTRAFLKAER